MAQSNVGTIEQLSFSFKVENVSKLVAIFSPELIMEQGIPWKVRVNKKINKANHSLVAFLFCAKTDIPPEWTHAAFATFKLMSFDANVQAVEHSVSPYVYDHKGTGHGTLSLIKWENLMDITKGYVKDDTIVLNCTIKATDPNEMSKTNMICANVDNCCDEHCWSIYRLTIGSIKNLMAVRTPELKFRNLPFRITVCKDNMKGFCFLLSSEWNSTASCKIQATVKLISSNAVKTIEYARTLNFQSLESIAIINATSWNELMMPQNGFVKNDVIVIDVEIKASQPTAVHPNDAIHSSADAKRAKMECPICLESIHQKRVSSVPCGHIFCTACITRVIGTSKKCPTCSKATNLDELRLAYLPM